MSDLISRTALLRVSNISKVAEYDETGCGIDYLAVPVDVIKAAHSVDAVPVVRCRECKHRGSAYKCPMRKLVMPFAGAGAYEDCTEDEGYCHCGAKMGEGEMTDAVPLA